MIAMASSRAWISSTVRTMIDLNGLRQVLPSPPTPAASRARGERAAEFSEYRASGPTTYGLPSKAACRALECATCDSATCAPNSETGARSPAEVTRFPDSSG